MATAILSSIIRLTDRLAAPIWRPAEPSLEPPSIISKDLDRLKRTLPRIKAVLNDAEEREIRDESVKLWLTELKYLAYDAEDVLGEFDYELLRAKVEGKTQTRKRKKGEEVCDPITSLVTNVPFLDSIACRIKKIGNRFDEIAEARDALHLREGDGDSWHGICTERPPSSSRVEETNVFGREDDKNNLVELLLSDGCRRRNLSVIPIVGMGGIGKTTLAQLLFNDQRICEHFELREWVCVSQNFEVVRLTRSIIESFTKRACDLSELSALHEILVREVKGKRFLVVLDDLWNEQISHWEIMRIPLTFGADGSAVIVTTRNEPVAKITQTVPFYTLKCLSDEDSWSVFQQHAFGSQDSNRYPELVKIGKKIVRKCDGLPLAAKALGALLFSEVDTERWDDILQSNLWDLNDQENGVLPALRISYHHLPAHLKRCFLFSSLFYKNHEYKKDELVLLWMANGFIESRERKQVEAVGIEYFDELLRRSFFQYDRDFRITKAFVMHHLIHDLAQSIAGEESSRTDDGKSCKLLPEVRHLLLAPRDMDIKFEFPSFNEQSSLRTFLFMGTLECDSKSVLAIKKLNGLFQNLKCLRALHLSMIEMEELPDSIDNLKHLRYLWLGGTRIRYLPESICRLYNLQTLDLRDCPALQELPRGIENLTYLRYLYIIEVDSSNYKHARLPIGIGRLTDLQTLPTFGVSRDSRYCGIEELKDIVNLRGKLCISGLCNVRSVEAAKLAKLKSKVYIEKLTLIWPGAEAEIGTHDEPQIIDINGGVRVAEEDVLESLQPQPNLTKLDIQSYGGVIFPSWMGAPTFTKLVSVSLYNCTKAGFLPPLGDLPFLKELVIRGMSSVEHVGPEFCGRRLVVPVAFPSLESLEFHEMHKWQEWRGAEEVDFPHLKRLRIDSCLMLRRMSLSLSSLTELTLWYCRELTSFPTLTSIKRLELLRCDGVTALPTLPSLSELILLHCSGLASLPTLPSLQKLSLICCHGLVELHTQPSLKELYVSICKGLAALRALPLLVDLWLVGEFNEELLSSDLTKLKILKITNPPNMKSVPPRYFPELEELTVQDCGQDESIDWNLTPSLRSLHLLRCTKLCFLPDERLPSSLRELSIDGCPLLREWCQRYGDSRLNHVPRFFLDSSQVRYPDNSSG